MGRWSRPLSYYQVVTGTFGGMLITGHNGPEGKTRPKQVFSPRGTALAFGNGGIPQVTNLHNRSCANQMIQRPIFFPGVHQPSDAGRLERCMISINRLERRVSDFEVHDWILDSGAFTRISTGRGHIPEEGYVRHIERWAACGNLLTAVSQDYMCEPFILRKAGQSVAEHQARTIARYQEIRHLLDPSIHLMPVLQGYEPEEYVQHIRQYGVLLQADEWVGVGSVCKRNASVHEIEWVLDAIRRERPDLRLHGFGLKITALRSHRVNQALFSCDSMAWSFSARREGRNGNDIAEAIQYTERVAGAPVQLNYWPNLLPLWERSNPGEPLPRQA